MSFGSLGHLVTVHGWKISPSLERLSYFPRKEMAVLINDAIILSINEMAGVFRNGFLPGRIQL